MQLRNVPLKLLMLSAFISTTLGLELVLVLGLGSGLGLLGLPHTWGTKLMKPEFGYHSSASPYCLLPNTMIYPREKKKSKVERIL
jgi:hypothetical protein